jgi:hypothetical protein
VTRALPLSFVRRKEAMSVVLEAVVLKRLPARSTLDA